MTADPFLPLTFTVRQGRVQVPFTNRVRREFSRVNEASDGAEDGGLVRLIDDGKGLWVRLPRRLQ